MRSTGGAQSAGRAVAASHKAAAVRRAQTRRREARVEPAIHLKTANENEANKNTGSGRSFTGAPSGSSGVSMLFGATTV